MLVLESSLPMGINVYHVFDKTGYMPVAHN